MKELSSRFPAGAVFILCHPNCICSFSIWRPGQDVEFDCIGS